MTDLYSTLLASIAERDAGYAKIGLLGIMTLAPFVLIAIFINALSRSGIDEEKKTAAVLVLTKWRDIMIVYYWIVLVAITAINAMFVVQD